MKILEQLLCQLSGAHVVGSLSGPILRVHTDTRSLQPGDLFVALAGEKFDAHDYLAQAKTAGAVGALAHSGLVAAELGGVEVPDSLLGLGELAGLWRQQCHLPVIAVAGSNGKTTVTQMVASIFRAAVGNAALATQGNFNNHIGVPLTLLRLRESHRLAVVELGMNHPGEIAYIARLAAPTVALVNNAQREHQEFMATVEAVALENGEVIKALQDDGVAVFPSDDLHTPIWSELAHRRNRLTFSEADTSADVHATRAEWREGAWAVHMVTPSGAREVSLHIAGRHNVRNALAATACALAAGVALDVIVHGLSEFKPVGGRSRALALNFTSGQVTVVDDTYNANPDSVLAAIRVLAELPAPRMLVLGDMGEVGERGLDFHLEVLRLALSAGMDSVLVAGDWMRQASQELAAEGASGIRHWSDVDALAAHVGETVAQQRSLLVKGSRFMRMERVVQAAQAKASSTHPQEQEPTHAA